MIENPRELEPARLERAARVRRPLVPAALGGESSVRDLVRTLYEQRWLIAGVALAILGLSVVYLLWARPVYESRVVVQVEDTSRTLAGLEDISAILSEKRPADTEIAIMRSQVILGTVVSQLGLDVEATPEQSFLDRVLHRDPGARVQLRELVVPDALLERPLVLTAAGEGRYELATAEGEKLLEGELGRRAATDASEAEGALEIVVSELEALPGTRFAVRRRDRGEVIEALRESLEISEATKGTGIIEVTLRGEDPHRVAAILNAFASAYLRQNVERKSAEAEHTLEFLDAQLPVLKRSVERAEAALEEFQTQRGTVSLSRATESMLDRSVDVERQLSELELQRTELRQKFTERHPQVTAITQKIDQLRGKRASMEGTMRKIPASELESARLTRDHKVASQLYDVLLNKAQELRVTRSGIVGNVRILDQARAPRDPAAPKRSVVLTLGSLLALGVGFGAALLRRALDAGADDADEIEARVGLSVFVTIPHSERQARIAADARRGRAVPPLVAVDPGDPSVEGVRSLRTALQFALVESRNNVIAIGSPTPGVGKSFVSVNLAILLAGAGNRVLLVDADLRRGRLHRAFGLLRQPGLSDVLSGASSLDGALHATETENLDFLATGKIPPNPAELLASQRFEQVMKALGPRYDYVLVDTPPVLAVTDSTLVARCTGVNLLVLRAGQHPYREIALAVRQFTQSGFPVQGAILNDARSTRHGYGRYGRYYEYRSELR
jgi:tyrosine-protein kinase Etk/Wzc